MKKLYRTYVEVDGKRIIIFPRSKKRSLMTIREAERRFEVIGKRLKHGGRGVCVDREGKIVFCMAI